MIRAMPQIALTLIEPAQAAKIRFQAVVADCFYGDNEELEASLGERKIPSVWAHRGAASRGWAPAQEAHSCEEALQGVPLGAWTKIPRCFSDGHTEVWWAVELQCMHFGPLQDRRAICVTTDRRERPELTTWYLSTNLKRASLEDIVARYAQRQWVEQGYKQVKDELGWADFQVRSDAAIRRHGALVCAAFCFCWWQAAREGALPGRTVKADQVQPRQRRAQKRATSENKSPPAASIPLAARGARVARPVSMAHAMLARLQQGAPAACARRPH
jgi:SRSO17 transposase